MIESTKALSLICSALFIASCSSSSDDNSTPSTSTGVFVDSPVSNIGYSTETLDGTTNAAGEFDYLASESVTFNIGSLILPTAPAAASVSPLNMTAGAQNAEDLVSNVARLLQSLDEDSDTSNGIQIPAGAATVAAPIDFDVPGSEFETNAEVINLVANSGSSTTSLIAADVALAHLNETLGLNSGGDTGVAALAGYWDADSNDDYTLIGDSGAVTFYDYQTDGSCYTTRAGTLTQIQDTLYQLDSNGETVQVVITRIENSLNILLVDSFTLVTESQPSDLVSCP